MYGKRFGLGHFAAAHMKDLLKVGAKSKYILPFAFNTKRPLSNIWLQRYKQNNFGCFLKNWNSVSFWKAPKIVLLISQQPNIAQRPFCIQNERQDILYHLI